MSKNPETKIAPKSVVVGVDDGYAMTKVVIIEGGKVTKELMIPSRARSGIHGTSVLGGSDESGPFPGYETEGVRFTVGDIADAESARFNEYPFSGMNRVIVNHALRLVGLAGVNVRIATGLPLSTFYMGGEPNSELIGRKDASIRTVVKSADDSTMPNIVEHSVFPEGLAAWVDYAIGEDGEIRVDLTETVGVIDIGGRTTDIAVVLPGKRIDHARCGSADIGVLDVVEAVGISLFNRFKVEFPGSKIEQALRTRSIKKHGTPVDIGAEIDAAVAQVMDSVMREVSRRLGTAVDVDKILLVGGGAYLFNKVAKSYPNVVVPEAPEFANARGFAKYLSL